MRTTWINESGLRRRMKALVVCVSMLTTQVVVHATPGGQEAQGAQEALEAPATQAVVPPTLERIRKTGVIRLGHGETLPFAFRDNRGVVTGYTVELCLRVVEQLRQRLGVAKLEVEYVARTARDRVKLLAEGAYDIECNSSTNTPERRRSAAFSIPFFFSATRYVALADSHLRTIEDLRGRSVSVTLGTINIAHLAQVNQERKLNLSLVPAKSSPAAFELVAQGRTAAFVMDDVVLAGLVAAAPEPERYALSGESLTPPEPYGLMMRLGDTEFSDAVNAALRTIYARGDMTALYERWFMRPVAGRNVNLKWPMSAELRQVIDGAKK